VGAHGLKLVPVERPADEAVAYPAGQSVQRLRIIDGALRCMARQGVAKTTLDDVAREAACSRATVYRAFPGGKEALMAGVGETEVSRFFSALAVRLGRATSIEDVIVYGMSEAAERINGHEALSFLLEHEPEIVLPHLAFAHMDTVLSVSSAFVAPFLGRWLDHEESLRVAEWVTRILLSYIACPAEGVDLSDERSIRRLVRTFVLPGVRVTSSGLRGAGRARGDDTGIGASRGPASDEVPDSLKTANKVTDNRRGEAS
jgi:AcrR family transcriptional regulator